MTIRGPVKPDTRTPIAELEEHGLPHRIVNWLDGHGMIWIEDLQVVTEAWLLSQPQAGPSMAAELRAALRSFLGETKG